MGREDGRGGRRRSIQLAIAITAAIGLHALGSASVAGADDLRTYECHLNGFKIEWTDGNATGRGTGVCTDSVDSTADQATVTFTGYSSGRASDVRMHGTLTVDNGAMARSEQIDGEPTDMVTPSGVHLRSAYGTYKCDDYVQFTLCGGTPLSWSSTGPSELTSTNPPPPQAGVHANPSELDPNPLSVDPPRAEDPPPSAGADAGVNETSVSGVAPVDADGNADISGLVTLQATSAAAPVRFVICPFTLNGHSYKGSHLVSALAVVVCSDWVNMALVSITFKNRISNITAYRKDSPDKHHAVSYVETAFTHNGVKGARYVEFRMTISRPGYTIYHIFGTTRNKGEDGRM